MRIVTLLLAALIAPGMIRSGGGQSDQSATVRELEKLDQEWLTAAREKNTEYLAKFLADGFVEVHASGEVVDKAKQISQIKASTTSILEIHPDDISIRYLTPDVALLTDTTTIKGVSEGNSRTGTYRVLRVFIKQNGQWLAAGAGLTPIPTPDASPSK